MKSINICPVGWMDGWMDGWVRGCLNDGRTGRRMEERKKKDSLGWIFSMSFKIRRSYIGFYKCSNNFSVMIKEGTVKV